MNDRETRERKKETGKGGLIGIILVAAVSLINMLEDGGIAAIGIFVVIIAVVTMVVLLVKSVKKKKRQKPEPARQQTTEARGVPSVRQAPLRTAERPVYTPQTVFNENASVENFQRDRQRRISQLDGFLKNGIIDKEEYKVLLSRYERDI